MMDSLLSIVKHRVVDLDDVAWTIPAIWNDSANMSFREAARKVYGKCFSLSNNITQPMHIIASQ